MYVLSKGETPEVRWQHRAQRCANFLQFIGDHQHLGRTIFDNVGHLFSFQSRANGGVLDPGAVHSKTGLQKLALIGHEHGHIFDRSHATRTQYLRYLIGPRIQLPEADLFFRFQTFEMPDGKGHLDCHQSGKA